MHTYWKTKLGIFNFWRHKSGRVYYSHLAILLYQTINWCFDMCFCQMICLGRGSRSRKGNWQNLIWSWEEISTSFLIRGELGRKQHALALAVHGRILEGRKYNQLYVSVDENMNHANFSHKRKIIEGGLVNKILVHIKLMFATS